MRSVVLLYDNKSELCKRFLKEHPEIRGLEINKREIFDRIDQSNMTIWEVPVIMEIKKDKTVKYEGLDAYRYMSRIAETKEEHTTDIVEQPKKIITSMENEGRKKDKHVHFEEPIDASPDHPSLSVIQDKHAKEEDLKKLSGMGDLRSETGSVGRTGIVPPLSDSSENDGLMFSTNKALIHTMRQGR